MKFTRLFLVLIVCLAALPAIPFLGQAADPAPVPLEAASAALGRSQKKIADFWLARHLSAAPLRGDSVGPDLKRVLLKRSLDPAAFLPATLDGEFLDWFETTSQAQWNVEIRRTREKYNSVELRHAATQTFHFTVVAYPELQDWFTTGGEQSRRLLMVLTRADEPVKLFSSRHLSGVPTQVFKPIPLEKKGRRIHAIWPLGFHDADGDGSEELWLRYNLISGNGYNQVLCVYKFDTEKGPTLLRRFDAGPEGTARRLENGDVETGHAEGSTKLLSRMELDSYRFEIFRYQKGEFSKISSRVEPNILKSKRWKELYK